MATPNRPTGGTMVLSPFYNRDTLTPVTKRQHKISLSPQKADPQVPKVPQSKSYEDLKSPPEVAPRYDMTSSSLEFEEFSFIDEDGGISTEHVSREHMKRFRAYLFSHYTVFSIHMVPPFLVLHCEDLPGKNERPFSIAGMVTIWKQGDEEHFDGHPGHSGEADDIEIDPDILSKIEVYRIPPEEVILYLANKIFPDCTGLSILYQFLVIELPETSETEFVERLQSLPHDIIGCPLIVEYHNGPLANTEKRRRLKKPKPRTHPGQCDETDYISLDGKFYPGAMLSSIGNDGKVDGSVTAGILIEKDSERRMTCSFHNWSTQHENYPGQFGQTTPEAQKIFMVVQGNPGTVVGFVCERIGRSDIALAQLYEGMILENQLMDIPHVPKSFIHSGHQHFFDEYLIDTFVTGKQRLKGNGARFQIARRPGKKHHHLHVRPGYEHMLPEDGVAYIEYKQGAYAINEPIVTTQPVIREGICGAVLMRCKIGKSSRKVPADEVLEKGEVCAMMHYADLAPKYFFSAEYHIIYADAFDPLIDEGWKIVQNAEGSKEEPIEESPKKKQKP